jgi:hypothetical protein
VFEFSGILKQSPCQVNGLNPKLLRIKLDISHADIRIDFRN